MQMLVPLEVGISVHDLDSLSDFYIKTRGFSFVNVATVSPDLALAAGLSASGYRVTRLQTPYGERLKLLQPLQPPSPPPPDPFILDRRGTAYLTFIIDDLDAMIARLTAAGLPPLTGADKVEVRSGVWLAFARDPEGNFLEFVQYADIAQ